MEELKLEWMSWYDKFKMLLHRWTKRDKAEDTPGGIAGELGPESVKPAGNHSFPHSRRGF